MSVIPYQPGQIVITTTDGQQINLSAGHSGMRGQASAPHPADMLPGAGGKPLPRLIVAQPKDDRVERAWAGQFAISQSESGTNDQGELERFKKNIGPLGDKVIARAVGYTMNRSFMPKYDPKATGPDANKPLCRSENFIQPDTQFAGKFSDACVRMDMQRGRLVPQCPHAKWGERDAQGKSTPPACNETYVVCLAVEIEGQWVYFEAYFKSSAAKSGATLVSQLRGLEREELPLYSYPIELTVKDAGVGYSYTGRMILPSLGRDEEGLPENEDEIAALEAGCQRWAEAIRVRQDRAARPAPSADGTDAPLLNMAAPGVPIAPEPPAQPVGQEMGNKKKKPTI